ncbi:acyltransferase domain-containing protein [Kribbella sp. CA-293567]|uniref:acyltransferase domain-containing protein n=1 Tax=Kribbella sp. CA-293567 TaxID=3002436 RepID=UPI0022DD02E4|nr:acyltransferase domain-containing protein [Kribbella sp. CA-293567]WBQ03447.1 acyltransferase domain-containing protein [Kribbella sp. CA-293567]
MTTVGQWQSVVLELARHEVADLDLPGPAQAIESLRWLGVPELDLDPIVATMPDRRRTPERWQALQAVCRVLTDDLGTLNPPVDWPSAPAALGEAGRYFYVHAYLAVLPLVRDWHAAHGISDEISQATLADLGAKMELHRQSYGVGGLTKQNWFVRHLRGSLFRLGRLQFDRTVVREPEVEGATGPVAGEPALEVHISVDGPMNHQACSESFAAAVPFFAKHFPDETYRWATCASWLLDDQLAEYLPAESNIIRFQRRFTLWPRAIEADRDVLEFVFQFPVGTVDPANLPAVPQDSTLQRAITSHLAAGRHWQLRLGWIPL